MRLIGLPIGDPVAKLVLGHGEHPDIALYRTGWTAGRPLGVKCRDGDVMVTSEIHPISPTDTSLVDRMVAYEEPGIDEAPLTRQRVGAYSTVSSKQGLLNTVTSRLTGVPGAWNLLDGGLDTDGESTAGLLHKVHEETSQQAVPGRLPTLQSDHWTNRVPNGGLEDYHILRIIYSTTYEEPSRPHVHDSGGSMARAD